MEEELSPYEIQRQRRIMENRKTLEAIFAKTKLQEKQLMLILSQLNTDVSRHARGGDGGGGVLCCECM